MLGIQHYSILMVIVEIYCSAEGTVQEEPNMRVGKGLTDS